MKFPRNARIFQGRLDATPFVTVLFLVVMFVVLGSLVYTPGIPVPLQLPVADNFPGAEGRTVAVAVDATGGLYFENQPIDEAALKSRLQEAVKQSHEPLTLVLRPDRDADSGRLIQICDIARQAGVTQALIATLPRLFQSPASGPTITTPAGTAGGKPQ